MTRPSRYFRAADVVLWNPANRVAEQFIRTSEALAPLVGMPTGIGQMREDEYELDLPPFVAFVDALVVQYLSSGHAVLRSLLAAFTATALVLVDRAGCAVPSLQAPQTLDPRDVAVGPDGVAPAGDATRLRRLADAHARAMPA